MTASPTTVYLKDYRPTSHLIPEVALDINLLSEDEARIAHEALTPVPPVRLGADVVLARALLARGESARALDVARAAAQTIDASGCVTEADVRVRLAYADALAACDRGG